MFAWHSGPRALTRTQESLEPDGETSASPRKYLIQESHPPERVPCSCRRRRLSPCPLLCPRPPRERWLQARPREQRPEDPPGVASTASSSCGGLGCVLKCVSGISSFPSSWYGMESVNKDGGTRSNKESSLGFSVETVWLRINSLYLRKNGYFDALIWMNNLP